MDNILCWNFRGMNAPNNQKEIKLLSNKENIGLVGLLETKIKVNKVDLIASKLFGGWEFVTNLSHHYNGRVWITWRPDCFQVVLISSIDQAVTGQVYHVKLRTTYLLTVVYAFNTQDERRSLWEYLEEMRIKLGVTW